MSHAPAVEAQRRLNRASAPGLGYALTPRCNRRPVPGVSDDTVETGDALSPRTIELIDVLWLRGHAIVAAFEIESTTLIYSVLLRTADLIAMQPNLNIPLYLVAPDKRREKVLFEGNRPTFSHLSPPLAEVCRFIPFSPLRERLAQVAAFVRYLGPDLLNDMAESCEVAEA
jgi:hypothetical protein